jgi:N-carbamoyl-L-amino-acid hydrolase
MIFVDSDRLRADFDALAEFGAAGDGGLYRPSLGEAHLAARAWCASGSSKQACSFTSTAREITRACWRPERSNAPTLLLGSHTDSVPHGGRFDGALEVLRVAKEHRVALAMNLEAIDFTDEEGTLVGLLGSTAMAEN